MGSSIPLALIGVRPPVMRPGIHCEDVSESVAEAVLAVSQILLKKLLRCAVLMVMLVDAFCCDCRDLTAIDTLHQ